jgi:hypothetical protein
MWKREWMASEFNCSLLSSSYFAGTSKDEFKLLHNITN